MKPEAGQFIKQDFRTKQHYIDTKYRSMTTVGFNRVYTDTDTDMV